MNGDAQTLLLPAALEPAHDPHGARFAAELPERDGAWVPLPELWYVFIVFTNRSGSTYLRELLASTGWFNRAGEPLNAEQAIPSCQARGLRSLPRYFAAIAAEQQMNGWWVTKASIGQIAALAAWGILGRVLPRARFIVTERTDKLAQVISWQIAAQTGRYTSEHAPTTAAAPVYDRDVLLHSLGQMVEAQARTALFLSINGIVPLHITYEFLTRYPDQAGAALLDFLGAPAPRCDPSRIALRKQADATNEAWRRRFLAGQ